MNFGYYYTRTGAVDDALKQFDQARQTLESLHKELPTDPRPAPSWAAYTPILGMPSTRRNGN
jgi:hypothetical protein